jgi:hypothetical protein
LLLLFLLLLVLLPRVQEAPLLPKPSPLLLLAPLLPLAARWS